MNIEGGKVQKWQNPKNRQKKDDREKKVSCLVVAYKNI
jgi:hypothetical protein